VLCCVVLSEREKAQIRGGNESSSCSIVSLGLSQEGGCPRLYHEIEEENYSSDDYDDDIDDEDTHDRYGIRTDSGRGCRHRCDDSCDGSEDGCDY
jgi:hypothetical protein